MKRVIGKEILISGFEYRHYVIKLKTNEVIKISPIQGNIISNNINIIGKVEQVQATSTTISIQTELGVTTLYCEGGLLVELIEPTCQEVKLTKKQLCEVVGVSLMTLNRYEKSGQMKPKKPAQGRSYYTQEDIIILKGLLKYKKNRF